MPDDRLQIEVEHSDGTTSLWSDNEVEAGDVPSDMVFTTDAVGGHKDLSMNLLRDWRKRKHDLHLFDGVKVLSPGGTLAWGGRQMGFGVQLADQDSVDVDAVGWSSKLDDTLVKEIVVHRDPSAWQGPSVESQIAHIAVGYAMEGPNAMPDPDTGEPALRTSCDDAWSSAIICRGLLDCHGIPIEQLYAAWKKNNHVNHTDGQWSWRLYLSASDLITAQDDGGDLRAFGPGTDTLVATTADKTWAAVQLAYGIAAGAPGNQHAIYWTCLAVYGRHGMTKRGTNTYTEAQGFWASDIIRWLFAKAGFVLTEYDETSYVLPHMVWFSPTKLSEAMAQVNNYHRYDMGCWGKEGFFKRPHGGVEYDWVARRRDGAKIKVTGAAGDELYDRVSVSYKDALDGRDKSVDWTHDDRLEDSDPTSPLVEHGEHREGHLRLDFPSDLAGAVACGEAWLREHSKMQWRGTIEIPNEAEDSSGHKRPTWRPRATEYVQAPDFDSVNRKIVKSTYRRADKTIILDVDNTPSRLDAMLERAGLSLVGVA